MVNRYSFYITISILSSIVILFLLTPIVLVFLFADYDIVKYSLIQEPSLSSEAWKALLVSIKAATTSTLILLVCGVPLAYVLARRTFLGKSVIESVLDMPLLLPHAVAGILVLLTYSSRTPIGNLLSKIGIVIEDSFWGIVAAMMFVSAPIMIDTIRSGIESLDPMLECVARSLGASPARVFLTITLPLSWRSIVTAILMTWARSMSEVGAILIVAYYPKSINVLVIEWFNTYGLQYAVALTIPLLLISITLFTLVKIVIGGKR